MSEPRWQPPGRVQRVAPVLRGTRCSSRSAGTYYASSASMTCQPHFRSYPFMTRSSERRTQDSRNFALLLSARLAPMPNFGLSLINQCVSQVTQLPRRKSTAAAVQKTSSTGSCKSDAAAKNKMGVLRSLGMPAGLARLVTDQDSTVGMRIFILDNSGSTQALDGSVLDRGYNPPRMRRCTRWEEIKTMAMEQAVWGAQLQTPCSFFLLNPPETGDSRAVLKAGAAGAPVAGRDYVNIDTRKDSNEMVKQGAELEAMLSRTQPGGVTPLAERIAIIRNRLEATAGSLMEGCQRVFLVLCTDGLPTTVDFGRPSRQ